MTKERAAVALRKLGLQLTKERNPRTRIQLKKDIRDLQKATFGDLGIVVKEGGEYCVRSEHNPRWSGGCYPTRGQATRRLSQVEYFKKIKGEK